MLIRNDITELLGLEDVKQVKNMEGTLHIWLELPLKPHQCPSCGAATAKVHNHREQKIKDIPLGRATYLHLRKDDTAVQNAISILRRKIHSFRVIIVLPVGSLHRLFMHITTQYPPRILQHATMSLYQLLYDILTMFRTSAMSFQRS